MANDLKYHHLTWTIENVCLWGKLLKTVVNGPNFRWEGPGSPWMLKLGQSTKYNGIVLFIKRLSKYGDVTANVRIAAHIDNNLNPLLRKNFRVMFNNDDTWESPVLCTNQWFKSLALGNNMCKRWEIKVLVMWQEILNYPPNTEVSFTRREKVGLDLKAFVENEKFSDIFIKVENEKYIPAHKVILAARCPYLSRKIDSRPREDWKNVNEDLFTTQDPEIISAVLKYLYSGNVKCVTEINPLPFDVFECAIDMEIENLHRFTQPYYFEGKTSIKTETVKYEWAIRALDILRSTKKPVTLESEEFGNPLKELFVIHITLTPPKEDSPGSIEVFLNYVSKIKRNISVIADFLVKSSDGSIMLRKKAVNHDMTTDDSLLCVNILEIHRNDLKVNSGHENLNFFCEIQYSRNETEAVIVGVPYVKSVYQSPLDINPVKRHLAKVYHWWIEDMIHDIKKFLLNETYSDCVIIVGRARLPAHKVILAARSRYFFNHFSLFDSAPESSCPMEVHIEKDFKITLPVMKIVLEEIYTGSAIVQQELSEEIYRASVYFGLGEIEKKAWSEFEFYSLGQKFKNIP